jgi:5-dehydro-4-deoxyglucarate dehydratase
MEPAQLRTSLENGVIAFPITPFDDNLELDLAGLRRNLEHMLQFGFKAIVAAGGTGEMYSLSMDEYKQVVETTVEVVGGKSTVLAGAGFGYAQAVEMSRIATKAGVDGVLALPPYYTNAPKEGLYKYYEAIAGETDLGILVYSRDWVKLDEIDAEILGERISNLAAWKEGQGDTRTYQRVMKRMGDRFHWIGGIGDDCVPAYYSIGIRTYTSSIATVAPKISLKLHELASENSPELAEFMHKYVIPIYEFRTRKRGYEVSAMKALMNLSGQVGGKVRPPLTEVKESEIPLLQEIADTMLSFV